MDRIRDMKPLKRVNFSEREQSELIFSCSVPLVCTPNSVFPSWSIHSPFENMKATTWGHTNAPSSIYPLPNSSSTRLINTIRPRQADTDVFPMVLFHFPLICVLANKDLNLRFYSHGCIFLPLTCLTSFRFCTVLVCKASLWQWVSRFHCPVSISFFCSDHATCFFLSSSSLLQKSSSYRRVAEELSDLKLDGSCLFSYPEISYIEKVVLFYIPHSYQNIHWPLLSRWYF